MKVIDPIVGFFLMFLTMCAFSSLALALWAMARYLVELFRAHARDLRFRREMQTLARIIGDRTFEQVREEEETKRRILRRILISQPINRRCTR